MRSCCSSIHSHTFSGFEMGQYRLTMLCSSLYVRHINTFVSRPFSFLFLVISLSRLQHILVNYHFCAKNHTSWVLHFRILVTNASQMFHNVPLFKSLAIFCHCLVRNLPGILLVTAQCCSFVVVEEYNRCGLITKRGKIEIYHQCVIAVEQKIIDTSKFNDGPPCRC